MFLTIALAAAASPTPVMPTQNLLSLMRASDYPADALRKGEQGSVVVSLGVNSSGKVESCTVIKSSNSSSLDRATCEVYRKRARFTPATGANGQAVPGTYQQTTTWLIPGNKIDWLSDARKLLTLNLDQAGKIASCEDGSPNWPTSHHLDGVSCAGLQPMAETFLSLPGRKGAAHPAKMVIESSFDFDPPNEVTLRANQGTQIVDAVARFEVDKSSQHYVSCKPIGSSNINPCGAKPAVTLAAGSSLGDKEPRTGTARIRVWVSDGEEAR